MAAQQVAPYGSWRSPITSELIVGETIGLGQVSLDKQETYWLEARPSEGGRNVIVRRSPDGRITDVTPPGYNVRSRVHEYGGGAYLVADGTVYFVNFTDQRLYRQRPDAEPHALTPAGPWRYADAIHDRRHARLICVREDHSVAGSEAVNTLVAVPLDAPNAPDSDARVLVGDNDFYAAPRLSPDGNHLAWLTWRHPNMPWDGCELWVGMLADDGSVAEARLVAGGATESIFQPEWSPDGVLHFVSDRTGWWNLYRWQGGHSEALCPVAAEFGEPQWVFGMTSYAFVGGGRLLCTYTEGGEGHLALLDTTTRSLHPIDSPYTVFGGVRASGGRAVFRAASASLPTVLVQLDVATGGMEILRRSSSAQIAAAYLSTPAAIEFPTEQGRTAYGLYYPPANAEYSAPAGERPPLLVMSHGGPTSATTPAFNLSIQYWTSRGIAVLDVNYGGSTGYGREYRQRLVGQWGIVDVDDCVNGARALVERGLVDGTRLAITGGSAGGYTTLAALTFRQIFKAGASHFGVGDLEALARDTHKFESRYMDGLVGPYPAHADRYRERSPINHTDRLACPVIFFQGLEDRVVPPNQAETMVAALRAQQMPVAYVTFAGEGHGFRRAENIRRALDGELYFYSRVFGFALGDPVEPVEIENAEAL